MLEQLIAQAWQSYSQRNASLKDIDIARENDPGLDFIQQTGRRRVLRRFVRRRSARFESQNPLFPRIGPNLSAPDAPI